MGKVTITNLQELLAVAKLKPSALSADTPLFSIPDSEVLLGLCERNALGVLGVEGFKLSDSELVPDMDFIGDFSVLLGHADFEEKSINSTRSLLMLAVAEGKSSLFFEYVLANRAAFRGS